MRLEDLEIARCASCGKLLQLRSDRLTCNACKGLEEAVPRPRLTAREERILDQFAEFSGIEKDIIAELVRDHLVQGGERKSACVRCGRHEAMEASDFCINCKVDLFRSFGEASHELFTDMASLGQRTGSLGNTMSTLEQKRSRTATSRINVVGARPLKKY